MITFKEATAILLRRRTNAEHLQRLCKLFDQRIKEDMVRGATYSFTITEDWEEAYNFSAEELNAICDHYSAGGWRVGRNHGIFYFVRPTVPWEQVCPAHVDNLVYKVEPNQYAKQS